MRVSRNLETRLSFFLDCRRLLVLQMVTGVPTMAPRQGPLRGGLRRLAAYRKSQRQICPTRNPADPPADVQTKWSEVRRRDSLQGQVSQA